MKFGPVPLEEALGAVLAHGTEAADPVLPESLTYTLRKGTRLTEDHLRDLRANGVARVIVARPEAGDVLEDAAAARLARAVAGPGLEVGAAGTGRVNLRAAHAGLVRLDAAAIEAANRIDPGVTIATVPPWQKLGAGGLAATIKIIPFAVAEAALVAACEMAQGAMALTVAEIASATLIETTINGALPSEKGRQAMAVRLGHFSVQLSERVVVPHETGAIAEALAVAPGELRLILTASATCDPRDVAPEAVRQAGGAVIHYGMPVDPGNLLFLGQMPGGPVIGLPGCARSPALNGADWVLERVICGVPLGEIDIPAMGVGGLLKEIPGRRQPREQS